MDQNYIFKKNTLAGLIGKCFCFLLFVTCFYYFFFCFSHFILFYCQKVKIKIFFKQFNATVKQKATIKINLMFTLKYEYSNEKYCSKKWVGYILVIAFKLLLYYDRKGTLLLYSNTNISSLFYFSPFFSSLVWWIGFGVYYAYLSALTKNWKKSNWWVEIYVPSYYFA